MISHLRKYNLNLNLLKEVFLSIVYPVSNFFIDPVHFQISNDFFCASIVFPCPKI